MMNLRADMDVSVSQCEIYALRDKAGVDAQVDVPVEADLTQGEFTSWDLITGSLLRRFQGGVVFRGELCSGGSCPTFAFSRRC
jgi:hypothetical protein